MDRRTYEMLEAYMLECMRDAAHDSNHVYRVLYAALEIAGTERGGGLRYLNRRLPAA